jgi:hypothetical protein
MKPTNHYMKTTPLIPFLFLLLCSGSCFSQVVTDPKQDFISRLDPIVGDTYEKLEADFNNDGRADIAYTAASLKNEFEFGERYSWDIYIKITGGYKRIGSKDSEGYVSTDFMIDFRKDRYWIGMIPELNAYGLLTMTEGGIKQKGEPKGRLKALLFDADGVRTVNVGSETTDIESLKRRFPKILTPPVQLVTP